MLFFLSSSSRCRWKSEPRDGMVEFWLSRYAGGWLGTRVRADYRIFVKDRWKALVVQARMVTVHAGLMPPPRSQAECASWYNERKSRHGRPGSRQRSLRPFVSTCISRCRHMTLCKPLATRKSLMSTSRKYLDEEALYTISYSGTRDAFCFSDDNDVIPHSPAYPTRYLVETAGQKELWAHLRNASTDTQQGRPQPPPFARPGRVGRCRTVEPWDKPRHETHDFCLSRILRIACRAIIQRRR